jgi:hypothetical protein
MNQHMQGYTRAVKYTSLLDVWVKHRNAKDLRQGKIAKQAMRSGSEQQKQIGIQ